MSTIKVNTIRNSADVEQYLCKAWVNFNGTGTVAIRASGNVSSITDSSTGQYIVNFTTSFADISYSAVATCKGVAAAFSGVIAENHDATRSASALPILCSRRDNGGAFDSEQVNCSFFR